MKEELINQAKLDLACGQNRTEGFFGIDSKAGEKVDTVMDLNLYPWPIESESAEEIICNHYVEHIPHDTLNTYIKKISKEVKTFEEFIDKLNKFDENAPSEGLIKFMDEVYRILKPGGKIKIISPYYTSMRCWQDPTHVRAINEASWFYFNKNWRDVNKLDHYGVKSDFDFTYGYDISTTWANRNEEAKNFAILHYNNVINDIHVLLTKKEIKNGSN